MHRYKVNISSA